MLRNADPFADTQRIDLVDMLGRTQKLATLDIEPLELDPLEAHWFDAGTDPSTLPQEFTEECPRARIVCAFAAAAMLWAAMFVFVL